MVPIADRTVSVNLRVQASGYIAGMKQAAAYTTYVGSEAEKLARKADGFRQLGTAGVAVGVAVLGIGAAALKTGIAYNTLQQQSRKALTTMLGSAEAARAQLDKFDEFARTSPFAKQTFLRAQQQMIAFGVATRNVIPYLDAVQNAVAAAGGGNAELAGIVTILSKIQSSAKITAVDLMQFGNYGVNAAELIGISMGKTGAQIREEITNGSIGAEEALDALTKGMATKFAGASDGLKETFVGSTDRMKAAWRDFGAELAKPLVNPDGGGMLIDLFNVSADALRSFIALPEPIKATSTVLVGLAGGVALLGGASLLAIPKIAAFKAGLVGLNLTAGTLAKNVGKGGLVLAAIAALSVALSHAGDDAELTEVQLSKLKAAFDAKDLAAFTKELQSATGGAGSFQQQISLLTGGVQGANYEWNKGVLNFTKSITFGLIPALNDMSDGYGANETRLKEFGNQLGELAKADLPEATRRFNELVKANGGGKEAIEELFKVMPGYEAALREVAGAAGSTMTQQELFNFAVGEGELALKLAREATRNNAADLAKLAGVAQGARFDIDGLTKTILGFGKGQFDVNAAQRDFQASIDSATKSIAENGKSLDITTDAGRSNQAALDAIAKSAVGAASAIITQTGSQEDATAAIQAGRDALIEQLAKLGITGKAAQDYADDLGLIPENIATAVELNLSPATRELNAWLKANSSHKIRVAVGAGGGGGITNYQGGIYNRGVKAFASGGFASGIYKGVDGGIHKFAEKEMGVPWEAYISGRASDRDRNLGLWEETGRRLGAMQSAPAQYSSPFGGSGGRGDIKVDMNLREVNDTQAVAEVVMQGLRARLVDL